MLIQLLKHVQTVPNQFQAV